MEIKDYVKQFRDLQKSHKKVRVADFCRENAPNQVVPPSESYIKEVMLSFPKGLKLTVREITPSDLVTIVQRLMPIRNYA